MSVEIAGFLFIFVAALVLFSTEIFSADVIALGLMLTLIVTGMLTPEEAFKGFGSETVLMILGLLVMTEALVHTGVVDITGRFLLRYVGTRPSRLAMLLLIAPAVMSSFISNTASVAFFLPIALGLASRAHLSASRVLMPMAFAAILASSVTLIGTSTNLVVSGLMQQQDLAPLTMFELTPVGLPILLIGLLYMYFAGRHIIPDRTGLPQDGYQFDGDLYISEILIPPNSPWVGKSIDESPLLNDLHLGILRLYRGGETIKPLAETLLEAQDELVVEGRRPDILMIPHYAGLEIKGAIRTLETYTQDQAAQVAEVIILPNSPLEGRTIQGLGLRERYKLQILAISHSGSIAFSKLGRQRLNLGDILLVQAPSDNLHLLESERLFRVMDIIEEPQANTQKARLATLIFMGALSLAIFKVFPIAVAVLIGMFFIFVTRCITPEQAYRNIEWKTLILIGSMLAFGQAMQATGTADYLAAQIIRLPVADSPMWILGLFFILAMILTQPMSNQAAAAILVPIAIQTANLLGYNPRPFAVMIAIAASCSFITPLEPACVIIYSAGKYRFMDFMRVGGLLTVLVFIVAMIMVPMIWHL